MAFPDGQQALTVKVSALDKARLRPGFFLSGVGQRPKQFVKFLLHLGVL